MTEDDEKYSYLANFPTELLLHIFSYLSGHEVIKCRRVCSRWRLVIDGTLQLDVAWEKYAKSYFKDTCYRAYKKARSDMLWYELYRCLSSWYILNKALEVRDEFASASIMRKEIRSFEIISKGCVGVLTKGSIDYYNLDNLTPNRKISMQGDFTKYTETEHYLILLNIQLNMLICRKIIDSPALSCIPFSNVKTFLLVRDKVYFVDMSDELHVCDLQIRTMSGKLLKKINGSVMCLGSTDDKLHLLTFERNIYTVKGEKFMFECALGPEANLLHQLRKYNLLDQLDWRVYFQWMYVLNQSIPEGPLRDIVTIRAHGDVYFVGSNWGVLRIYYAPYADGELDLFNTNPIKQYNFMERYDCPVLSMCPILTIDVMERVDGHTLLVAMPKKIAVIKFTHDFQTPQVKSVLSVEEQIELCGTTNDDIDSILKLSEVKILDS